MGDQGLGWRLNSVLTVALVSTLAASSGPRRSKPTTFTPAIRETGFLFNSQPDGFGPALVGAEQDDAQSLQPTDFKDPAYEVAETVTPTKAVPEAEEHIAVDPNKDQNLIAVVSDFSQKRNRTRYAVSSENGKKDSWKDDFVPLETSDGNTWYENADPVVAMDRNGTVYLADLYNTLILQGERVPNTDGLYVSVQQFNDLADGGFKSAQTYPVLPANTDPKTNMEEDKEWIAVDNSDSKYKGNIYVVWLHLVNAGRDSETTQVLLSRSTDGGKTWSKPPEKVTEPTARRVVKGPQVAIGPKGEVYVVYLDVSRFQQARLWIAKASNGEEKLGPAKPILKPFRPLPFTFPDAFYKLNSFPALAVSPTTGALAIVYSDNKSNDPSKTNAEVELIVSTDGGDTFSDPQVINDDSTGQQFLPALTADRQGIFHASWFDTRNSKGNNELLDVFATYTKDDGKTLAHNARVTSRQIDVGMEVFIGDYCGTAAGGGFAHPVWTNISVMKGVPRKGGLQTATLALPK